MNNSYLERAKKVVTEPRILVVLAAKRSKQLALGARPTVKCKSENFLDVALLEIAEGKIVQDTEFTESEAAAAEAAFAAESKQE